MSSILQAQQFYTAGIPLLEAYLLPMANNQTRNERLSAASHVVQIHTHVRFPQSKKWLTYQVAVCRTNRKHSSFATKHFQRKSLKFSCNLREKAMKHMRAVESDCMKSARKAKDKLHKACEEHQKFVSELCIGRNKTECTWQA